MTRADLLESTLAFASQFSSLFETLVLSGMLSSDITARVGLL